MVVWTTNNSARREKIPWKVVFNANAIEKKAAELREHLGGTIFAFPIDEQDPFSKFTVVMYLGGSYHIYPEAESISVAALGVQTILEQFKKLGADVDFEKDVRLVSYEAQINAPDVTMRRLKKENVTRTIFQYSEEVTEGSEETGELLSARGLLKLLYLQMVEDENPKSIIFMAEYYKLLATRKYGKTASAIRQEVRRMTKNQAIRWIENTYKKYVREDMEVFNMLQSVIG